MRIHEVKGICSHDEYVMASARVPMVITQSSHFAIRLDVIVKQGAEIIKSNVLNARGDLLNPLLQSCVIHL